MADQAIDTTSIVVITGGCGGMGLACARRLGRRHALVLADIDAGRLEAVAHDLRKEGYIVTPVACDITQPDMVARLAATTNSLGTFRTLVHTAGLSPSMADGRRVMDVNMVGTARLERAFLALAVDGSVAVLVASIAGHMSRFGDRYDAILDKPLAPDFLERIAPDLASSSDAYIISKHGVIRYCERAATEWGARGGRIVTISPGMFETPMGMLEFERQPLKWKMLEIVPLKRLGAPDEIAAAVEFLASPAAAFITGTDLRIDGGISPLVSGGVPA